MKSNQLMYNKASTNEYFDKFVFYFCLIDILFLPYAFFMSISYSIFLLFPWLFMRFKNLLQNYKDFHLYILFSIFAIISTIVGIIINGSVNENVSRLIQIIQIIGYYFIFKYYLDKNNVNIKIYLLLFYIFVIIFCIIYNFDKSLYIQILQHWNPRGLTEVASLYNNLIGYRYSFMWMDPNNIAYMFVGIVAFIITNENIEFYTIILLIIGLVFVLISAMSNGGIISFVIETFIIIITYFGDKNRREHIRIIKIKNIFIVCVLPLLYYIIKKVWNYYSQSEIAQESFARVSGNSIDSRIEIYNRILQRMNYLIYLFIGYGGSIYIEGIYTKPHNGHLYMILSYGFIAYFIFMYLIFRKRNITPIYNFIWIIAIFLGFTVNILIGEVKLSAIIMLLIACISSKKYLIERKHIKNI